ncbi:hypothetical protein BDV38DRAFT_284498 [Aspergillus pseudotamarii]|uniref:EF-hand domain-containing protein n=1 Tax=Aspergillus pseudotamarii TaxID=132259 RepID=A0A5N6SML7_ASPPS|nr:uncharacterized protein BDV38DRAFT_284498 [Aspergillus pseudotamarii]KAE8135815.1 hypothetical protein BDV38DRAFT_284498 [Aspergillus pseudotamarii]
MANWSVKPPTIETWLFNLPRLAKSTQILPIYSREEIEKWKEEFHKINTNYDSHIDPWEYLRYAKEKGLKITDEEAVDWVRKLDVDGNGQVEFGEFLTAFGTRLDAQK